MPSDDDDIDYTNVEVLIGFRVTTSGNRQLFAPANPARVGMIIFQDGTGTDKAHVGGRNVDASGQGWPMLAGERVALSRKTGACAEFYAIAVTGTPVVGFVEIVQKAYLPGSR